MIWMGCPEVIDLSGRILHNPVRVLISSLVIEIEKMYQPLKETVETDH